MILFSCAHSFERTQRFSFSLSGYTNKNALQSLFWLILAYGRDRFLRNRPSGVSRSFKELPPMLPFSFGQAHPKQSKENSHVGLLSHRDHNTRDSLSRVVRTFSLVISFLDEMLPENSTCPLLLCHRTEQSTDDLLE